MRKRALVCGAGGFLGSHLAMRLKEEDYEVIGVDLVPPAFRQIPFDGFILGDLRIPGVVRQIFKDRFDEIYQFAAEMGGAGYIFTGQHDAKILHSSAQINLNILEAFRIQKHGKCFFASSACVYPTGNQMDPQTPICSEDSVYPALPDSEYGWEKLFAERLYLSYARNYGVRCCIARLHNVYGPFGIYEGGREKAPAALCRKVALAAHGGNIELWGDGAQTRSFTYIDDAIEGIRRMMMTTENEAINLGSEEMVSINELARMIIELSGKQLSICHIEGPMGVRGRNSDNRLIRARLGWEPNIPLRNGLQKTYQWILESCQKSG